MSRFQTLKNFHGSGVVRIDLSAAVAVATGEDSHGRLISFRFEGDDVFLCRLDVPEGDSFDSAVERLMSSWERARARAGYRDLDLTR